jgi:hypothetical protein
MGRKLDVRKTKNFFDPTLSILGGGPRNRYIDVFHRDAARKIQLTNLTRRIRTPVNMAGVEPIPDGAVIYGIYNTDICRKVTLETLTTRMGVAAAISQYTQKPSDKISLQQLAKARKLAEMHEPFLSSPNGPFVDDL